MLYQAKKRSKMSHYQKFLTYRKEMLRMVPQIRDFSNFDYMGQLRKTFQMSVNEKSQLPGDVLGTWKKVFNYNPSTSIPTSSLLSLVEGTGVRDSIRGALKTLNSSEILLPHDIYPVYRQIAEKLGVETKTYRTNRLTTQKVDVSDIVNQNCLTVLITNPTPVNNTKLSDTEIDRLLQWLKNDVNRHLIIDSVYSCEYDPSVQPLLETSQTFQFFSLTKTHAHPLLYGVSIVPKKYANAFSENITKSENPQLAKFLMATFPLMGKELKEGYAELWKKMGYEPVQSYYHMITTSHSENLSDNYLTIPVSVFDSDENNSVLSCLNWVDEIITTKQMVHITSLGNFARGYDKYTNQFTKENIPESTFADKFHLLPMNELRIGMEKVKNILDKSSSDDCPLVMITSVKERLYPSESGKGYYIKSNHIPITDLMIIKDGVMKSISTEEAYAESLKLHSDEFKSFDELEPRTVSVLPIAFGCQAKCPFCFSHSSISNDTKQKRLDPNRIDEVLNKAKQRGASRAVITGGGEPMMLPHDRLLSLIRQCSSKFPKTVMITNGYAIGKNDPEDMKIQLKQLEDAGLNILAVSRHGYDSENNKDIMHLDTLSEKIAETMKSMDSRINMRWVCVLQKGGIDSEEKIGKYLDWVKSTGVAEICFKELYVSTSSESVYHDHESNQWSRMKQVPLSMLVRFLENEGGTIESRLPWGSPVYNVNWKGHVMKIACYTEPSLYWERSNGICRSWNLLADGVCYASLEDRTSSVE